MLEGALTGREKARHNARFINPRQSAIRVPRSSRQDLLHRVNKSRGCKLKKLSELSSSGWSHLLISGKGPAKPG